ncbi:hypothetical protein [Rivularia sp. UHCC 0363]|uniref:hypothetical protein n=1 Tax=Rivularia sp. UHCC 0363 TaxID=3110244 RepID=UPI002B1F8F55|nr:hypothetical protein [Rivularia sp. UHCC 0363]MEA5593489.1 hypothetical protein [Rivularia sp. UHCC 0363]
MNEWYKISKNIRKPLNKLWGGDFNLANLRNDVLHAGFRKNPKSAKDILQQTETIVDELKNIAKLWGLQNEN